MTFNQILILHLEISAVTLVFSIFLQAIYKKNLINNWIYIHDFTGVTKAKVKRMPIPIDGIIKTVLECIVPILNVYMLWFIAVLCLGSPEDNLIQLYKRAREEMENNGYY